MTEVFDQIADLEGTQYFYYLKKNPAIIYHTNRLINNEDISERVIDGHELNAEEIDSFKRMGYEVTGISQTLNDRIVLNRIELFYKEFDCLNIDELKSYLIGQVKKIKTTQENIFVFKFKKEIESEDLGLPLSKELYTLLNDFLDNYNLNGAVKFFNYDFIIEYSSEEYKETIQIEDYYQPSEAILTMLAKGNTEKFITSIPNNIKKIYVPKEVKIDEYNILYFSYLSIAERFIFIFEDTKLHSAYFTFCSSFFTKKMFPDYKRYKTMLDLVNQYVVVVNGNTPIAIGTVTKKKNSLIVPAVTFDTCLQRFEDNTIMETMEIEEIVIKSDDTFYGLDIILEKYNNAIINSYINTTDKKIQYETSLVQSTNERDNGFILHFLNRLVSIARKKLKYGLVSASELTFVIKDNKLMMFIFPKEEYYVECDMLYLGNGTKIRDMVSIDNLVPTYIFDNWLNIAEIPETKTDIEKFTSDELKSYWCSLPNTSKLINMGILRLQKRFREMLFFMCREYTDDSDRLYQSLIKSNNDMADIVQTNINGRLLTAFDMSNLT